METKGLALPPALQQLCSHLVRQLQGVFRYWDVKLCPVMPNKFKYDEHRTDDANSGSHLAFLLFPHPFIFSLYRKRSHNCKVQPVKKKHRTLRNTLASTALVPSTSFTCHTDACKLCITCPASKPGQRLTFSVSLMLLYQEQGICYSLHGRRRTLLTERHIRKKSNATMPRLLGRFWRHHVPYHLDWWTLTSQSWNHSPAIQSWIVWRYVLSRAGPHIVSWSPPQHSHQSWMIAKAFGSSEMECGTVNRLIDTNLCTKSSLKSCRGWNVEVWTCAA